MSNRKITRALISVFYKDNLEPIVHLLGKAGVEFVSTGGTQEFIEKLGYAVTPVEKLTGYPSIFGGRVKTLHPAIFGGILYRRDDAGDLKQSAEYKIPPIDLVIVDLYPFEETVAKGGSEEDIIEKIDIGGISLIRGAAKNFNDVVIIASRNQYTELQSLLESKNCSSDLADRKRFAAKAFDVTSHYDSAIFNWFNHEQQIPSFKKSYGEGRTLRYGENPHQQGKFFGNLDELFEQLNGKELSYNNLVDVDAAVNLVQEFSGETAFVIIKHTNACGVATGSSVKEAYLKAFQADTTSAFGGVLATNKKIDRAAAEEINTLFFEILIAPAYDADALELLKSKKNRMIMVQKKQLAEKIQFKSLLNGVIEQDLDLHTDSSTDLKVVTKRTPTDSEVRALLFASKIAKHTKSNTIVLAVEGQLLASGVGQTSRVDALRQAIEKAKTFGFSLKGSVMASDAFFPFADCVKIAQQQGIEAVIQPGGSLRDQDSINFCDSHNMAMVTTGIRHFRH
ncbi:MAG TPA: bifunctional phosphoribosylaminoimidazolecarboxamide formyltransferase/IMP cyclohydrolase [Cyclobacteriaceae bacterium]|nr:bifunctional phosphoribosylaminoimidazolecarboxamide formyltransferase/IMP cyclohydrolase [Cyclobacteriaceae bacterium]HMV08033.1 bifunctional phosphoribosylaminoimidazolecarboxamide formyltransferase/IMP cyclohydrolase [Cyclobacteriaceae bacterium]HMV88249.1 bifunctional phosphoribosylaminoimidazolecarboxamide formyltransferase/IMP cyclohydrolase [Cyclobacteriaceae bacterium]HMX00673.1 bifunctional phosphoribosylaminoimidazolecarboxamide formyltransferase/IMP cyclohydrolase [Cyclobacteriacea